VTLADRAAGGLAHGGERFGQQVVEQLAFFESLPELGGFFAKLRVGERLELGLQRVDLLDQRRDLLDRTVVAVANDFFVEFKKLFSPVIRSQESGVRIQNSGVRSQNSEFRRICGAWLTLRAGQPSHRMAVQ
jgi:hypothetical protein